MEYREAIEDCFEPEKEIVTYSSIDELLDKIKFYNEHMESSLAIRNAGYHRTITSHTYRHRLNEIMNKISL